MFELHPQLAADTITLGDLPLCRLVLVNDAQYPWLILVPRRADIQESYQLSELDQQQLLFESNTLGLLLMGHFKGDKLNIANLGNIVPQLHVHHVVRFRTDPAWPRPVWGVLPSIAYEEVTLKKLVAELTQLVASELDIIIC
ncbi:HIT domain-containing protein [Arenicella sp.]|nr:HIT domain-containing protein [Arenicella sp.]